MTREKSDARKIKAFITRQDDVGRDAYGRVEDVEHIGRTCVYWHTGNNPYLLISEEGNRRFIPFYLVAPMNIDLLRQEKDQIWAEVVPERIGEKSTKLRCAPRIFPSIQMMKYIQILCWKKNIGQRRDITESS